MLNVIILFYFKYIYLFLIYVLIDVFDFMNCGNPSSNSKHSLFDHFKRNLDLECNIPKFDVNTGILRSKIKTETVDPDIINNQTKVSKQKSLIKLVEKQELHSPPPQMIQPAQIQPSYYQLTDVNHQSLYYNCCGQEMQHQNDYQQYYNNYSSYAPFLNDSNYHESTINNSNCNNALGLNPISNGSYFPFSHYYQSESGSSLNSNSSSLYYQSASAIVGGSPVASNGSSLPSFNTFLN